MGPPVLPPLDVEMNGTWEPYSPGVNGNTAADFVAMWRHLHDLADQAGATNVTWFGARTSTRGTASRPTSSCTRATRTSTGPGSTASTRTERNRSVALRIELRQASPARAGEAGHDQPDGLRRRRDPAKPAGSRTR